MHIQRLSTSHAPVFLVNSRLGLVTAAIGSFGRQGPTPPMAPLLPKLRGQFAEFLNQGSLDRLGILYLSTCVGLGYGQLHSSLEAFLGSMGFGTSTLRVGIVSQPHAVRICLDRGLRTCPRTTIAGDAIPSCVSPSLAYCGVGR